MRRNLRPAFYTTLLQEFRTVTVFYDHLLHGIADAGKLQPIAKTLTGANDRIQLCLSGRIRKCQLQPHGCTYGDGARNKSAKAAGAQAVGPTKGGIVLSVVGK